MIFPPLIPSSRTFTPGEYPATAFSTYNGRQNRVRHSNVFVAAQLRLSFKALPETDMLAIWNHYAGKQGEFQAFTLPTEIVSYGSISDYVPSTYRWRYAGPGTVEDLPCGGHNVSITLESVAPIASSVVGAQLRLVLILTVGVVVSHEPGITEILSLSLVAGAGGNFAAGLAGTLTLSLIAGEAAGDMNMDGVAEVLTLGLTAGEAAGDMSMDGVVEVLTLGLTAGEPGVVVSGLAEVLTLSLIAGEAANNVIGLAEVLTLSLIAGEAAGDVSKDGIDEVLVLSLEPGVEGIPVGSITYSQSSVWPSDIAATNATMTNGVFAETLATGTDFDSSPYVRMDLGAVYSVGSVIIGTPTEDLSPNDWSPGQYWLNNSVIRHSTDETSWTSLLPISGITAEGIYTFSVSFSARYIELTRTSPDFLGVTEFYALAPGQSYP